MDQAVRSERKGRRREEGRGGKREGWREREEKERERERERREREKEREVVIIYSSPLQLADHIRRSYQTDRLWSLKDRSCQL